MYGDPFYLTLKERDKVFYADLSSLGATYPIYRNIFMFQCLIGCRVSDLNKLTKANIVNGYKDLGDALLPRFSHFGYNKKIKEILKTEDFENIDLAVQRKCRTQTDSGVIQETEGRE